MCDWQLARLKSSNDLQIPYTLNACCASSLTLCQWNSIVTMKCKSNSLFVVTLSLNSFDNINKCADWTDYCSSLKRDYKFILSSTIKCLQDVPVSVFVINAFQPHTHCLKLQGSFGQFAIFLPLFIHFIEAHHLIHVST